MLTDSLKSRIHELLNGTLYVEVLDENTNAINGTARATPGQGFNYGTPHAFNKDKNAKGAKKQYLYKLGWKPYKQPKKNVGASSFPLSGTPS